MLRLNQIRRCLPSLMLAATLLSATALSAPLALIEGQNFATLAPPEPTTSGKKIEVLEFFSYGCIHCFEFEPAMRSWRQRLPADVQLKLIPASFNANFAMYARGYYAAEALGVAAKLHEQVFDAVWVKKFEVPDFDALANLYQRLGVDRDKFIAAARSDGVKRKLRDDEAKAERMKLSGTPAIYVDGKYLVLLDGIRSYDEIIQRLDALLLKVRAERDRSARN